MFNKILYVFSAIFFGSIVYKNYHLLDSIPNDLLKAKISLLLLALFLQALKYLVLAYNFFVNFKKSGVELEYWEVFKATFVYIYVSVSTPFVGAGGLLAFVHYAGHKNVSRLKVGAGAFLALLGDYLGFFLIIIFSLIFFRSTIDDFPVNYLFAMITFGGFLLTMVFLSIFQKKVSPTPNGIGIIESFVPEFMTTIGIDFSNSLIIITIFRFIYFYIPLFIGFYLSYRIFNGKN